MQSLVQFGPVVLKKILKLPDCISEIRNYRPLQTGGALHLKKT